ncbi:MAG: acetolactate decarboxylase [Pontiellaceae bacterium]|jgi:acetolactate decarboxylase|nr:acetolactate decarboxylase [Pontiellaceae bacterium]
MKKWIGLFLLAFLAGCATAPKDTLMQVSTIDALLAGAYDGQITLGELLTHGNTGIGTFDALEGEMIVIDRQVYQARADGTVRRMPADASTPFAAVVQFDADRTAPIRTRLTNKAFQEKIDVLAPNKNLFVAVRMDGTFPLMKVRSVPKQKKPYPPLAEVTQRQTVFNYTNVIGTVLGFRCPGFVKGVNVPGYHLHFISTDKTKGGHILDFETSGGILNLDTCRRFFMILAESGQFAELDFSHDRTTELERVEK